MEFHGSMKICYTHINMKAFAEAVNEANSINIDDTEETMFAKWLSVITQKEINNKTIIENACSEDEIFMAVSALARQSEDKIIRQAYQRRKDDIYFYNKNMAKKAEAEQRAEQAERMIEQERNRAEQERSRAEHAEAEIEQLRQQLLALQTGQKE